jgi:hypothetical protein
MERRKVSPSKSSPLPADYIEMVSEVFAGHFDAGLKVYETLRPQSSFQVRGAIYADEIVVAVSLITEGRLSATTVYGSCDFDPKASAPSVPDLLSACVDAIGAVFGLFMISENKEQISKLASESLGALDDVPLDWAPVESDQNQIYVKVDKSNPSVESLAEDWLKKNDPDYEKRVAAEQAETEKLFVTGPKNPRDNGN